MFSSSNVSFVRFFTPRICFIFSFIYFSAQSAAINCFFLLYRYISFSYHFISHFMNNENANAIEIFAAQLITLLASWISNSIKLDFFFITNAKCKSDIMRDTACFSSVERDFFLSLRRRRCCLFLSSLWVVFF